MLESIADLRSQLAMPGTASVQRPLLAVTIQHLRVQLRYNALVQGQILERSAEGRSGKICPRSAATEPATNCSGTCATET